MSNAGKPGVSVGNVFWRGLDNGARWRVLLVTLIMILGLPGPACNRPNSAVCENVEESGPPASAEDTASAGIPDLTPASSDSGLNVEQIVQVLEDNGWDREAAQKVAELNLRYFKILHETDPAEYNGQLATLCRLGSPQYRFAVQSVLIQCPELAGLLAASAQVAADGPQQIAKSIPWDVHKRQAALSLYMLHGVADDAVNLAKLLNEEGELIPRLDERGAWAAVDFLANQPLNSEAKSVYRQWVRGVLTSALSSPDSEHLASTLVLLSIHAPAVRELLEKDEQFRNEFVEKWWPIFSQKLEREGKNDELWGLAIHDPRIWTFFHQFKQRGADAWLAWGPAAVELLLDEHYASCRDQIFAALEKGDELVIISLLDEGLRAEPLFVSLLQRRLPAGTLAKALHVLQSKQAEAPALLAYWARLSNQALIEELGPPPKGVQTWLPLYNVYYLARKWSQGRNTNPWDWTSATLDATFLALEIGAVFIKGVPGLVRQGAKDVAEASAEQLVREAGPWGLRQLFHSMIKMLAKRTSQLMTIDITQAVRLAFGKSGLGRSTFKRLTGLEARVFMRADRRVVIDLLSLVNAKHPVGVYLRETAINAGFEQIEDSKVVQGAITKAAETIADAGEQLQAWKAHAAAWWLAVNHDAFSSEGERKTNGE